MSSLYQEAIALGIVILVLILFAHRRWKQRKRGGSGCDGCSDSSGHSDSSVKHSEHTIHFFRKRR